YFGRSAVKSVSKGVPNMNVLITIGAIASFVYSLYGTLTHGAEQYLFYETTATIITLVFLGNWLEDKSVQTTQTELQKLAVSQKLMANMIAYDDKHEEHIFPVESGSLKIGDLLLIKTGEQVPADCKVLWGEASVSEAILTGESAPVEKGMNDKLIGGSLVESGTLKAYVTAAGSNTVMNQILKMVKEAQTEKPPVQQLADKISAIFVPAVVGIALLSFLCNYFIAHVGIGESLLRCIAVLVISCPCAMGLATPAAIAVGLGRAARNGILFRNARSLEVFTNIKQVVFDKTGTLTTGEFIITGFALVGNNQNSEENESIFATSNQSQIKNHKSEITNHASQVIAHSSQLTTYDLKRIAFSLEKYSVHPIAKTIAKEWKTKGDIRWAKMEEIKGFGMKATDKDGTEYIAGSYKAAQHLTQDDAHNVYIIRNNELLGWIDVADAIRPEAKDVVAYLHKKNIKTILLSGDNKNKCEQVAKALGIDTVIAEQTPEQKLAVIASLTAQQPTAMIGDGINDAPALAKATVGISVSDATQIAMQSAQVVLMNGGLQSLPLALGLGKHTYRTIKSNLAWAFAYNIIAIPVAAFGFLNPAIAALLMGFSDVVLAINSVQLRWKRVV
ncbi:MAG: heavy metal translocating P-type ATPase, partial [Bacteroidota bacterium]|nr:heavy metal translocating P-type ATPase [Bacteroidota bacterium]